MSTPIKTLRDAIYSVVAGINLTGVTDSGEWEFKSKYPPKEKPIYPGFWVQPATNSTETLDSISTLSTYSFWVTVTQSYEHAEIGEDSTIDLADVVFQTILTESRKPNPFGSNLEAVLDGVPSGTWGFDEHYGERFYRIEVAIRVAETPTLDP